MLFCNMFSSYPRCVHFILRDLQFMVLLTVRFNHCLHETNSHNRNRSQLCALKWMVGPCNFSYGAFKKILFSIKLALSNLYHRLSIFICIITHFIRSPECMKGYNDQIRSPCCCYMYFFELYSSATRNV